MSFEDQLRAWESTWIDGPPESRSPYDHLDDMDLDQLKEHLSTLRYINEYGECDEEIALVKQLIAEADND